MRTLAFIGALAIIVAIGAAVYFFGGFYSVAVTAWEPPPVQWALIQVRKASIERHTENLRSEMPQGAEAIQVGARAYRARGCTNCHGGPGVEWAKFSEGLKPSPPDLAEVAKEVGPSQLFWVIKNGINMTGMPSFGSIGVPDKEIWSIVAFVKALPTVKDADFKAWTEQSASPPAATPAPAAPATPSPAPPAPKQ